jgi:hypothetical protein
MSLPCPFVYATGKRCNGRIVRVEAYKADIEWWENDEGEWFFAWRPGSHLPSVLLGAREPCGLKEAGRQTNEVLLR